MPDLVHPAATRELLESTGVPVDTRTCELLEEIATRAVADPSGSAMAFLHPDHTDPVHRWGVFVAAHLYDGEAPDQLRRPGWTLPSGMRARPLSALEQALCRVTVERWNTRHSAVTPGQYALAEASATSGELTRLPIDAVEIRGRVSVDLGGGRDQLPRRAALDDWGTTVITRRLQTVAGRDRSTQLLYDGADPGTNKAQASASGNLTRVLRVAGLSDDPTLNPTSIRNTCAKRLHEAGARVEEIADAMGAKSLDKLMRLLSTPIPD